MRLHSGFAIGTILLAVILIGVIVSAIAMASRNSDLSARAEQNRLDASSMIDRSYQLNLGLNRLEASGQDLRQITFGNNIGIVNGGSNPSPEMQRLEAECGSMQGILSPCTNEANCAWNPAGLGLNLPVLPENMFCNINWGGGTVPSYQYRTRIILESQPGVENIGYIAVGFRPAMCAQINSILYGDRTVPQIADQALILANLLGLATNVGENAEITLPDSLSLGRREGCFYVGNYFNAVVYYRLVS